MSRRVYISCLPDESELETVESLCDFLRSAGCDIQFGFEPGDKNIGNYAIFVAIVGKGYNCSTWLNGELHDAYALASFERSPRPRLWGLHIGEYHLPRCSEHIALEWIDENNREALLV